MSSSIAAVSHGLAAIAFLMLFVFLPRTRGARLYAAALAIASLLSALWFAVVAFQLALGYRLNIGTDILEWLRNAAWTAFLLLLLGPFRPIQNSSPPRLKLSVIAIAVLYILQLAFKLYVGWYPIKPDGEIMLLTAMLLHLVLAMTGLLLVEQLFRNTRLKEQWGIKYFCLGAAGMFAYDFYLYSNALLFRQIDTDIWAARGVANALLVPLVFISAARNPAWSLRLSVSRSMLFHSITLSVSAIYLLGISGAGYYLKVFGGSWGQSMQLLFVFMAAIALAAIAFSGKARASLRVFISKHFYRYRYDYREEWLRFTHTLSANEQELGKRSIQALADLVESPAGQLFICKAATGCTASASWNMSMVQEKGLEHAAFCQYLQQKNWVIDLQEYAMNPQKYTGSAIPDWLIKNGQAWLVVPLLLHRKLYGFVVLARPRANIKLNWEVIDLLKIAGSQAASYLAQEESAQALMVARQFESINRMSTFVVHDLKNMITQLTLLLANAEKHKNNPDFQQDMLHTLVLSVQKMQRLLHKLGDSAAVENPVPLPVARLLQQAVAAKSAFEPRPVLEIKDSGLLIMASWERLERVVGHLIQNAIEATPREGRVSVSLERQEDSARIAIQDTGQGMSEEFIREKLFSPFASTKYNGMGIGVFESREYIHELGGRLEVFSSPTTGSLFQLILPIFNSEAHIFMSGTMP